MEFENKEFGICKLLQCDYEKGIYLVEIKEKSRSYRFVITSQIMKDGTWIRGDYYATLELAKERYETDIIIRSRYKKNDSKNE